MSTSNTATNPFEGFKLWYYTPSIAAAAIFAAIFYILTIIHTYRLIKSRTWFCIPFVLGALFEAIGYTARSLAHSKPHSVMVYAIQSALILVAPALFAASIYMILGRLMRATRSEHYSLIRTNWMTKIFVLSDVFCFFIQSAGGSLMATAKTSSQVKMYEDIVLGGLILQVIIFAFFVAVAAVFHSRLRKNPTTESLANAGGNVQWEKMMVMLYVVSVLIAVRNIFRVIEYGMGRTGYLLTHEWTLYVFDGVLMAVVLAVCLSCYVEGIRPGKKAMGDCVEIQSFETKGSVV